MSDNEKAAADLDNLDVTELEDGDLDEVAGGLQEDTSTTINNGCNTGCS
ncbi:MAG TPA: hypothetical protein VIE43_20185 [Thermoanaerobaculia bacterium]|jgi:hypothetical protein|nr:hypothetical protein [Thermoanaerobaculia bacterium]